MYSLRAGGEGGRNFPQFYRNFTAILPQFYRNFTAILPQFPAIFPELLCARPPRMCVGALCVPCAEVALLEAAGGLVTAPQLFRHFPAIFPQFVTIGLTPPPSPPAHSLVRMPEYRTRLSVECHPCAAAATTTAQRLRRAAPCPAGGPKRDRGSSASTGATRGPDGADQVPTACPMPRCRAPARRCRLVLRPPPALCRPLHGPGQSRGGRGGGKMEVRDFPQFSRGCRLPVPPPPPCARGRPVCPLCRGGAA